MLKPTRKRMPYCTAIVFAWTIFLAKRRRCEIKSWRSCCTVASEKVIADSFSNFRCYISVAENCSAQNCTHTHTRMHIRMWLFVIHMAYRERAVGIGLSATVSSGNQLLSTSNTILTTLIFAIPKTLLTHIWQVMPELMSRQILPQNAAPNIIAVIICIHTYIAFYCYTHVSVHVQVCHLSARKGRRRAIKVSFGSNS